MQIDQGRVLMKVFLKHKKQWKQYLFLQKAGAKEKGNQKAKEKEQATLNNNIFSELDKQLESETNEKFDAVFQSKKNKQQNVVPKKKSRFVSKSEVGSYTRFKKSIKKQ